VAQPVVRLQEVQESSKKEEPAAAIFRTMAKGVESQGPPKEAYEPERRAEEVEIEAYLVRILADNVQENEFPLKPNGTTTIGKNECDINLPQDTLLSERHASVIHDPGGYFLRDEGSESGVFFRVTESRPIELTTGTIILLGKQFLLFEVTEGDFFIHHFDRTGRPLNSYKLDEKNYVIGREAPDITLDSQDLTLSRRHLAIYVKEKKVHVRDLKSANGTYLKIRTPMKLEHEDQFRVGKSSFKFSTKQDVLPRFATPPPASISMPDRPAAAAVAKPQPAQVPPQAAAAPAQAGEPAVTFKNFGKTFKVKKGQSVCELAEENQLQISAECHSGICGSDPIRILSGQENLNELGSGESDTLQDICGLQPGECRLACVTKPKGPVVVEIITQ
jgi:pSer/pThr/pTyr-binding forkhead associated (FHA) protein/ferredoxin